MQLRAAIEPLEKLSKAQRAGNGEWTSLKTSVQQLKNSQNQLFEKPLMIITGGKSFIERDPNADKTRILEYDKAWIAFQKDFLKNSHKSMQIFAEKSGHFILFDQPEKVIEAIRSMINQYQNS